MGISGVGNCGRRAKQAQFALFRPQQRWRACWADRHAEATRMFEGAAAAQITNYLVGGTASDYM
jgi:hypothetical protein